MRVAEHYINGRWIDGLDGKLAYGLAHDPASSEPFSRYAKAEHAEIEAAIDAASHAFFDTEWAHCSAMRADVLMEFSACLGRRRHQIADCMVSLSGCLRREALAELQTAESDLKYYAGLARNIFGRTIDTAQGYRSVLTFQPIGVVAAILPWNAPIASLASVLGQALASGCAVVVSPHCQTALAHNLALECLTIDPRLPEGIVNSVIESGASFSDAFCRSANVDLVWFTGGATSGRNLASSAAANFKPFALNLDKKALAIVFQDQATEATVSAVTAASLTSAGQSGQLRSAIGHVLIEEGAYDAFVSLLGDAFRAVRVGPGQDPRSQMGCMIGKDQRDRIAAHVESLRASSRVFIQGRIPEGPLSVGAYIEPSLVEVGAAVPADPQMEPCGPVLYVESFRGEDQVLGRANALRDAGGVSIWSADSKRNERLGSRLRFATVRANISNPSIEAAARVGGGLGMFGGAACMDGLQTFLDGRSYHTETEA